MKEGEGQEGQEVLEALVVQEDPLVQELIPTLVGAIRGTLITEDRDRLAHQGDMVATLRIPGVTVAIPLILKATPKENEVQVPDQATHPRDLPTPCPLLDHPRKRKGDSLVVMMAGQRVRNQG